MAICQKLNDILPLDCVSNETFGMTVEKIICNTYTLKNNIKDYRVSKKILNNETIYTTLQNFIRSLFHDHPKPIKYTGENSNPVDFELENGKTLSVKTNTSDSKVAPQNNQKTIKQFYKEIVDFDHLTNSKLKKHLLRYLNIFYDKESSKNILKDIMNHNFDHKNVHQMNVVRRISIFTLFNKRTVYLKYFIDKLLDTDYLLYWFCDNLNNKKFDPQSKCVNNMILLTPKDIKYIKTTFSNLILTSKNITFSQNNRSLNTNTFLQMYLKFNAENINFSSTIKIEHKGKAVTIGEIQYHKKRDNLIFRFNIFNLFKLLDLYEFLPCSSPSYKPKEKCNDGDILKTNKTIKNKCCHKRLS
jgi:hypothetical protein